MKFETKLIHAGEPETLVNGAVIQPIYQSSTFEASSESGASVNYEDLKYIRLNNTPNHETVSKKLASLENCEAGLITGSGMAAITATLLAVLDSGDHLIAQKDLYGGSFHFLHEDFPGSGRTVSYFEVGNEEKIVELITPKTKAIYFESISNPLMRVVNISKIVEIAKKHKLVTVIDNTFPSPKNFNPRDLGVDLILHSATKYLNGHTDIVAGAVTGTRAWVSKINKKLVIYGGCLDPHACFLLNRGIKTLSVRLNHQNESALKLATVLEKHRKVSAVFYPGLKSHPDHARAADFFRGFGGMLAFEYKGTVAECDRFLSQLRLCRRAPSLGGVESLVTRPVTTSHASLTKSQQQELGISELLVRVSVGLEDSDDLVQDFTQALE